MNPFVLKSNTVYWNIIFANGIESVKCVRVCGRPGNISTANEARLLSNIKNEDPTIGAIIVSFTFPATKIIAVRS
jgi:hypothetical protein